MEPRSALLGSLPAPPARRSGWLDVGFVTKIFKGQQSAAGKTYHDPSEGNRVFNSSRRGGNTEINREEIK